MVLLLNGKIVRDKIAAELRERINAFASKPTLAIIQIGDKAESNAYIAQKKLFGESIGARVVHEKLSADAREREVADCIAALAANPAIAGIIVQLPLPSHLPKERVLDLVPAEKDVDGLSAGSRARLARGDTDGFVPATARGAFELLSHYGISVESRRVAVFGYSLIAGGPIAQLLSAKGARVSVINSKTPRADAQKISRQSDIVVVAIGKPRLIGPEYFRDDKTQVVVDVGINRITTGETLQEELPRVRLVGDVDFEKVKDMVAAISSVPGGVGPMTVAALFKNLVQAWYDTKQRIRRGGLMQRKNTNNPTFHSSPLKKGGGREADSISIFS